MKRSNLGRIRFLKEAKSV